MRMHLSARNKWVLGLLGGGLLLASSEGAACTTFGAEAALSMVDFCFLLDCQNGAFGGLVDPCGPGGVVPDRDFQFIEDPGLADCR